MNNHTLSDVLPDFLLSTAAAFTGVFPVAIARAREVLAAVAAIRLDDGPVVFMLVVRDSSGLVTDGGLPPKLKDNFFVSVGGWNTFGFDIVLAMGLGAGLLETATGFVFAVPSLLCFLGSAIFGVRLATATFGV